MLIESFLQLLTNPTLYMQLCLKVKLYFIIYLLNNSFLSLGLISNKMSDKVLDLLDKMIIQPDVVTLTIILNACAQVNDDRARKIGNKLLNQMPNDFRNDTILLNSAIHMLMRFGNVKSPEQLFESIKKTDVISYGAMMKGNHL